MRIRFLPSAILISALAGLPIAATSSAQSNSAVAQLADGNRSELKTPAPEIRGKIAAGYGKLPISFEANRGQTDKHVNFIARGSGYGLYLNGQEAVLALHAPQPKETPSAIDLLTKSHPLPPVKTDVVRMQLRDANPAAQPQGVDPLPGTANYFAGNDPSKWYTDIPTYSRVKFSGVYPGIDLVYYGNQSQLEYDFVVAPKADAKAIRLHFAGARKLALTKDGDLSVSAAHGQIAFHKPVIYQEVDGQRQPVEGRFTLLANRSVGFSLGRYDRSQPLIIDPVLVYSTYLGGSFSDGANAIAVDSSGNAYVAGLTKSSDFPVTPGALKTVGNEGSPGRGIGFITKLNPTGTALVYSTYFSGAEVDGIAVNGSGIAYVIGYVESSSNFPVTPGAFETSPESNFAAALNPAGNALVYSTYLSGAPNDFAVDSSGNTYITGSATAGYPVTPGAFQTTEHDPGDYRGFITKLNATGTGLIYSTYLSGSYWDVASSIAVDANGDAYVTGYSLSEDFPVTKGAFQTYNKGAGRGNAFVTELNPTGTALIYSTYLGGHGGESGSDIAVDSDGNAYISGSTRSKDFPVTPGAFQITYKSLTHNGNAFITKLNPTGTALVYSTYLGGTGTDSPGPIALDGAGGVYVEGLTSSTDFPITPDALLTPNVSLTQYVKGAFLTWLNATGTALLYSSYLEYQPGYFGQGSQQAIASGGMGNLYVAGATGISNFTETVDPLYPVTPGAFQTKNNGTLNAFVTLMNLNPSTDSIPTTTVVTSNANPDGTGDGVEFTATVTASGSSEVPQGDIVFSLDGSYVTIVPLSAAGTATLSLPTMGTREHLIQAKFVENGDFASSTGELSEIIDSQAPQFDPLPGKFIGSVTVRLFTLAPNVAIRYTLDGSEPTAASPLYTAPITLDEQTARYTFIRASAIINGQPTPSSLGAYSLVPQTPAPIISPGPGTYTAGQLITITDATPGATIRYTLDGSTPTLKSTYYTGPIALTGSETIQAVALGAGEEPSQIASASFTIQ